jgi:hypothetical protein
MVLYRIDDGMCNSIEGASHSSRTKLARWNEASAMHANLAYTDAFKWT